MTTSTSTAAAPTASASRYLQQLCKHWGPKFSVDFTREHGEIRLPMGLCVLDATPEALNIRLEAAGADTDQGRFESVVAEHLQRFAFREALQIDWARA